MALIEDFGLFEPMFRDGGSPSRAERGIQNRIHHRLYAGRRKFASNLLLYIDSGCSIERAVHYALLDIRLTKTAAYRYDVYIDSLVDKYGGVELFVDQLRHEVEAIEFYSTRATKAVGIAVLYVVAVFLAVGIGMDGSWTLSTGFVMLSAILPVVWAVQSPSIRDIVLNEYSGPRKTKKDDPRIVQAVTLSSAADRYYSF